jgi:hypothetical protein
MARASPARVSHFADRAGTEAQALFGVGGMGTTVRPEQHPRLSLSALGSRALAALTRALAHPNPTERPSSSRAGYSGSTPAGRVLRPTGATRSALSPGDVGALS